MDGDEIQLEGILDQIPQSLDCHAKDIEPHSLSNNELWRGFKQSGMWFDLCFRKWL